MEFILALLFWLAGIVSGPALLWFKINPRKKMAVALLLVNVLYVIDLRMNQFYLTQEDSGVAVVGVLLFTPFLLPFYNLCLYLLCKFLCKRFAKNWAW